MAGTKLLPCPFCGGEAQVARTAAGYWAAYCEEPMCGRVGNFKTEAEAIEAWNTRADDYRHAAEYWQRMYEEAFAERTCENNAPDYLDFLCSECGFVHYHSEANDTGEGNEWNYCPNCGARVTPKDSETTPKVVSE